ncbi:MAG: DUF4838 domain-containing protein, partial [Tepidisphaeraceae bacterium]
YNQHCEPPAFALEPNVYVQLTHGFIRGRYTFDELADLWPAKCRRMGFYEYFSVYLWDHDMLPGGVGANIAALRTRIAAHAAHGATSIDAESGDNWGPHGRGYYVANKLMWDPKADAGTILDDFYQRAFGPAAPAMKRYYERFDPGNEPLMSESLLAEGFRDVQEAATLAIDRPDVQARLHDLKHYLRFVQLTWDLQREKDKELRKAGTIAVLRLVCRTRFSYMNHWQALRHELASKAAREFDEPTWVLNDPSPKPWNDDRAYTAEETEKEFQQGLSRFRAEPVEQLTFSQDLVPARVANAPPAASDQRYQGSGRYAFYSRQGEPLTFEIKTGIIAWYRDRAAARYTITDATGANVAQGRLPQDGEMHPLEIEVPRAGLHFLDFDDAGAGWGINVAAGKSCSIVLPRGRAMSHMGHMQTMYFYVPKGSRDLRYYWLGGPHKVHTPDDRTVVDVSTSGRFVTIPVPDGQDGKIWSFTQLALGHLWFFNAPNLLAASPDALLLPRELVEKDKLPAGQPRAQAAAPAVIISDAKPDSNGILVHEVKSPFQAGTTQIRILRPDKLDRSTLYPVVYILPVEKLNEDRYGDGLLEVKKNDLHNKHQAIFVAPTFSHLPWYADHPANPEIRQETYLLNVVIPFIDRTYPAQARADGRLLLGFSKSGRGAFSLLLRHPTLFGKAAAWDAPLMKDKPNQFGMGEVFATQANFEEYQITKLLEKQAGILQDKPRLALVGYGNFRSHHQQAHDLMMKLKIAHEYRDGPERQHVWDSGWVADAVQFLLPSENSQPVR